MAIAAHASDLTIDEAVVIDEVVVTATRRSANIDDISAAITVVGRELVNNELLISDIFESGTGLYLQQTTPGQGAAIIRGQKGSALLHLVDGIRLNNALFRNAPTQYFSLVPVTAVERVEVIRGTPASLYGSDAIGGVVQVVTRVPEFTSAELQWRGDTFAAYESADLARILRATVDAGTETFVASMSAEYLATGDRQTGGGERVGPSGYDAYGGRLLLAATPRKDRRWLFDTQWMKQPDTSRFDELVAGYGQTEPSSSENQFKPNERVFLHAKHGRDAGWLDLDWTFDLAWQRIVDDRLTRDYLATERRVERNRSDLAAIAATAGRRTGQGSWIVGAEYYDDKVSSEREEMTLPDGPRISLTPRFPDGSAVSQASLYGNLEHQLSERHTLNGGLRYTAVAIELTETPFSAAADIREKDWSADIGWVFDATPTWQVVANLGLGFRAPNIYDLGTLGDRPGNRFNIPNSELQSEHVLQGDIGIRRRHHKLQIELTAYALKYEDQITSALTGDTTPGGRDIVQSVNAAESSVRGLEAGFDLQLSGATSVWGNINYTYGRQQLANDPTEPADRIPPLSGMLAVHHDASDTLAIEGWLRFAATQDRLSARDAGDIRMNPNGTPGWGIVGFRALWQPDDHWTLTAGMDNLLDRNYRSHGSGIDAPGRSVNLSGRYRW